MSAQRPRSGPWPRLVGVLLGWALLCAHVGTNQVVFEGRAGGYPVRVFINPPGVVPAQVPILVRVLEGTPDRVLVRAAQWNVGPAGAPPADTAVRVRGDTTAWSQALWLMTASSYAVQVTVEGAAGGGTVVVPLQTRATRVMGMDRALGALLLLLGGALVWGVLAIVRAAAREGSVPPGRTPPPAAPAHDRRAVVVAGAVVALLLAGGGAWWGAEAQDYRRRLDRPLAVDVSLRAAGGVPVLSLALTDDRWLRSDGGDLVPDHGKLLHLFLVHPDGMRTLAHLHPLRTAPDRFETALPPVPPGRYLLFGELLRESGAQYALVDTVLLPAAPARALDAPLPTVPALDPDDAWEADATPAAAGASVPLPDGGVARLFVEGARPGEAPRAAAEARLRVEVRGADGAPASLLPYMGMAGHAMVVRRDGTVFMHLHPAGMASMAAQARLATRMAAPDAPSPPRSANAAAHAAHGGDAHGGDAAGTVAFPVAFPSPGAYRVFVQLRRGGVARDGVQRGGVETLAFDVTVAG